jgi:hypothetical protein
MKNLSRSRNTAWPFVLVLCSCTYNFDQFAPSGGTSPDSGLPATEDGNVDRQPDPRVDDATSVSDASSSEGGAACADAAPLPIEASTNPCPSQLPAAGEACDPTVSNRMCRLGRVTCTCVSCGWTCQ